jgi:hypothetical protein
MTGARTSIAVLLVALGACGDNRVGSQSPDAPTPGDVGMDVPPPDAPGPLVRVFGHVEAFGEPQVGLEVLTLEGPPQTTTTDQQGDFYFDAPEGSRLIIEVDVGGRPMLSMIRGVIAFDHLRPRVFYLITDDEIAATEAALGISFDRNSAVVEVDFRNAEIGGYGATLRDPSNVALTPTYGVVFDDNGQPLLGQTTVAGGNGSTLLLAGLPESATTFDAIVPSAATLPCQPRDANPLPLVAGAVTWFDYECGNGTD